MRKFFAAVAAIVALCPLFAHAQGTLFTLPKGVVFDSSGELEAGAQVFFYADGTSTKQPIYTTGALSVEHTNPVEADANGKLPAIFLDPTLGEYKIVVAPASDSDPPLSPIETVDDYPSTQITSGAIGAALYPRNSAEISASVTPSDYTKPYYARGRYASFANWKSACDAAVTECFLDSDYVLTGDTTLPRKVDFRGYQLTGAYYTDHGGYQVNAPSGAYVLNWVAKQPRISQCYVCYWTGVHTGFDDTGFITFNGGTGGSSWNDMQISYTRRLTLDNTTGYVNFNRFHGGIARYIHLTGDGAIDMHGNWFSMIDVAKNGTGDDWGILQDSDLTQFNFIDGVYYELGSQITGKFHAFGVQADSNGPPLLDRFAQSLGATSSNAQTRGDYLSLGQTNLAVGGNWGIRDLDGKPPSLSHSGAASVSVQSDTTTPGGLGVRYQGTLEQAFDNFTLTFNTNGEAVFNAVVDYKSTADFTAITTYGPVSVTPTPVTYGMPTGWKRLRISGAANTSGDSTIVLGIGATPISPTVFSIGGYSVTSERAVAPPTKPDRIIRYANGTYDPPSLSDAAGVTTTFNIAGVALGDYARCSFGADLQGITLTGYVSSAGVVSCRLQNESGGVLDLASSPMYAESASRF
jgi:hypothetical protein